MKQQMKKETKAWIVDGENWVDAWTNHINQLRKMYGNNGDLNGELAVLLTKLKSLTIRMENDKLKELKTI